MDACNKRKTKNAKKETKLCKKISTLHKTLEMVLIHSKEHAVPHPEQFFEINFFFPDYIHS